MNELSRDQITYYLLDTWGLIASSSEGSSDVAGSYIGERSESSTVVVREYMIVRA